MHELHVVDDDDPDVVLALEAPAPGAKLGRGQVAAVVEKDPGLVEHRHGGGEPGPVRVFELSGPDLVRIDAAEGRHEPHRELLGRHLHAEHDRRELRPDGRALHEVERERGLSHRRTPRDDDEIAPLESGGEPVEVEEPGRYPGDVTLDLVQLVNSLHHPDEDIADRLRPARAPAAIADGVDELLRLLDELGDWPAFRPVGPVGDGGARRDHLAQHRALAHDLGVGGHVGRARGALRELANKGKTAFHLRVAVRAEPLGDGHDVTGVVGVDEGGDGAEDELVVAPVEVFLPDPVHHPVPTRGVEHEAAEHRALGLDRARGHAEAGSLGVASGGCGCGHG